jgi:hypothetical protein
MGRGRQKAKHTKVARDLKYYSPDTNYNALEKELGHPVPVSSNGRLDEDLAAWPEYVEPDAYEDKYAVDDDDEDEVAQNRTA